MHLQCRRPGFDPWVRKIPRRRAWLPTAVFLPRELNGQRSLAGYSPWDLSSYHQHHHLYGETSGWNWLILSPASVPAATLPSPPLPPISVPLVSVPPLHMPSNSSSPLPATSLLLMTIDYH